MRGRSPATALRPTTWCRTRSSAPGPSSICTARTVSAAWLFTVMHNVYVNQLRATRPAAPLDDEMPELRSRRAKTDTLVLRTGCGDPAPAADQREVLLLVALEEMSYDEAAARSASRSGP